MARAGYIWIVLDVYGVPLKAFTVKRELRRWLDTLAFLGNITVYRLPDGYPDITKPGVKQLHPGTLEEVK